MRNVASGLLALALVLVVGTVCAQPICLDGDADADTICDGDDNCPADANTDQSDVDADDVGDVCDPVEGGMLQPKVTLKASALGLRGIAKAYVQTTPPTDTVEVPNGLSIVIRDGGAATVPASWSAADCLSSHGAVRCASADRAARIVLKPTSNILGLYRLRVRLKHVAEAPTFVPPGVVELTIGDVTYQGVPTICVAKTRAMVCRYSPP
jgi:hypothetical protein